MCGLIGYVRNMAKANNGRDWQYNSKIKEFLEDGLFADTLRGFDSTGIAGIPIDVKKPVDIYKRALAAYDFLSLRKTSKMLGNVDDYKYILGHNRAATRGLVNDHTAHPFLCGDILLTHNGTLTNHRTLSNGGQYNVDSEALANHLNEKGIEGFKDVDGAFALAWYNYKEDSMNFIRNDDRPLWFGVDKSKKDLFYCSEKGMLEWLMGRNNLEPEYVFSLAKGHMLTITDDVEKMELQEVDLKAPIVYGMSSRAQSTEDWYQRGFQQGQNKYYTEPQNTLGSNQSNNQPVSNVSDINEKAKRREANKRIHAQILEEDFGFSLQETVKFSLDAFHKFPAPDNQKSSDRGNVYGTCTLADGRTAIVVAYNVSSALIAEYDINKDLEAEAIGVTELNINDLIEGEVPNNEEYTLAIRVSSTVMWGHSIREQGETSKSKKYIRRRKANLDKLETFTRQLPPSYLKGGTPERYEEIKHFHTAARNNSTYQKDDNEADDFVVGPDEEIIPINEFERLTKEGCAWCSTDLSIDEADTIEWTNNKEPICCDCQEFTEQYNAMYSTRL